MNLVTKHMTKERSAKSREIIIAAWEAATNIERERKYFTELSNVKGIL